MAFIVNIPVIITMEKNDQFCVYKAGSAFAFIVHALLIITYMALSIVVCVAYAKVAQAIRTKLHPGRCPATDVTMKATQTSSSETRSSVGGLKLTKIKIGTKKASINKVAPLNVAVMGLNQHGKNDVKTGDQKRESLLVPGNSPKPKDTNSPRGQWFTSTHSSKANRDIGCKKSTISLKQGAFLSHKTTRKVDRTTRIMFAVTLVFLLSWIPTWVTYVYREMTRNQRAEVGGKVAILFGGKLFIINTFANPFFYIWMSSVFKERAKKALKSICIPCT